MAPLNGSMRLRRASPKVELEGSWQRLLRSIAMWLVFGLIVIAYPVAGIGDDGASSRPSTGYGGSHGPGRHRAARQTPSQRRGAAGTRDACRSDMPDERGVRATVIGLDIRVLHFRSSPDTLVTLRVVDPFSNGPCADFPVREALRRSS
jgi:hypothetical protein